MTLTIELSDDQATALQAKAAAEAARRRPLQHIANFIVERMKDVPPEIMATMPADGASQHDHYIYGWPKKEA